MRLLPYVLVLAMAMPIFIWVLINTLVIHGNSTNFSSGDLWVLISLGTLVLTAFGFLSTWMSRGISKTSQEG